MPAIEDWTGNPLSFVNSIFAQNDNRANDEQVRDYFKKKISNCNLQTIPSLNDDSHNLLRPNSLVRFRCMIQDMFDPEFFLSVYEVKNCRSGATFVRSGLFRDVADCSPDEEILADSSKNITSDRMTFHCVSVPGENGWLFKEDATKTHANPSTSSTPIRDKRPLEEAMECSAANLPRKSLDTEMDDNASDSKRCKPSNSQLASSDGKSCSQLSSFNYPLPDQSGVVACLVKVYEGFANFRINEVVEFVGVLSVDPALAEINLQSTNDGSTMMDEEDKAHHPPPSLIPRLHVIAAVTEPPSDPSFPASVNWQNDRFVKKLENEAKQKVLESVIDVRNKLHNFFALCFGDDGLAADYLICHLLSSVYIRRDSLAIGKCSLNLSNTKNETIPLKFYKVLQQIVPKSHFLSMSLAIMNELTFVPKKDYTTNRLISGLLQLSSGTHMVVDELALRTGQLNTKGVQNVTSLGNLIRWQKQDYDFNFHTMEYNCDIPVLVFSEGKSLLPIDFQVPIKAEASLSHDRIDQIESSFLDASFVESVRNFITVLKNTDYYVPDDIQTKIQDDFVNMRKEDDSIKADDLHSLLVIARLISLSMGQSNLSVESWTKAKMMEMERKLRILSSSSQT